MGMMIRRWIKPVVKVTVTGVVMVMATNGTCPLRNIHRNLVFSVMVTGGGPCRVCFTQEAGA